ncbi:vacuolar-sorting protein SNF7, putative [Plasmodium berghei]|uniref:Vacuolar-sorting protein SNF7, putative n=2 Tax=Plasmodium berghei TaxID=5821 RepID=A0A509AVK3_PLABA|nr:vacuolar-sorting protein SNF7, putative [Plasmodium berghei ANKA]CXJ27625.1 vacuolar-sorting protein SNF7, putative [Plasmodium berghei]SCM27010.1 vacuolar-sorting protein SNF7, putative [Plasmodium berghei]SCN28749.1 vacuolar-sorting protein SNF7, putative [Plasmodium berghei]SCO63013.1 vacuolar-sorting protein SNF7, putative [Plasmodium berghei]SCO64496.1 vacuolar-sorting protein SNF7, putative [Plasmodium berghei]|eukprot:XP_034424395.1 vacuolar-sorting protein SNF7, putative [Plasmodium berghei ANKA]
MKFWFSKKKNSSEYIDNNKKNNDEIYKAILKNREAIDALEKKQVQVEKKIKQLDMEVKQKVQQNQMNNAKILLKRKKLYEQEIENILNNRLTLEDNMINLENMHLHKIAVNALSYAANTHKKFNNEINTQKVEKIIDTLQEHKDIQEEINQALCFNPLNNVDDDEIDKELNLLKEQSIQEKINTPVNNISEVVIDKENVSISNNVKQVTKVNEESDDEELKELIGEMT